MAQPIFRRLDSTIECYCSHAYVGKAYHLVTLSYPLLFVKKYCTGYDPRPIRPWPKHSQRPKLSPNLIESTFRSRCMIDQLMLVNYDLIGDVFARNNPCPRLLGIALGSIVAEQSFGGRNQF